MQEMDFNLDPKVWVLVADGEKALFFENEGTRNTPNFKVVREMEQDNPSTRDQGTDAPGRTSTTSSTRSAFTGTSSVRSSSIMREATSGSSLASSLSAPSAWEIERISIQCPSSMMVTSVASSHQRG